MTSPAPSLLIGVLPAPISRKRSSPQKWSPEAQAACLRFINGEITLEQCCVLTGRSEKLVRAYSHVIAHRAGRPTKAQRRQATRLPFD